MAKVLVAIPTFDGSVKARTCAALGNIKRGNNDLEFRTFEHFDCARARNLMAKAAIDGKFDYILMVDSDTIPPENALVDLMSHGVGVCIGFYPRGLSDDGRTNVAELNSVGYKACFYVDEIREMRESGENLLEVRGGGLGCALIDVSVFGKISKPYFKYVENDDGSALSEDYYFCNRCRNSKVRVFMDTRVGCDHIHDRILEAM